ncbi:hypothetical protein SNE40_010648 [Patella caerulea]|uniref:Cytochrome P450 n=1 Tax=Patella caerulea TaxID=87958 RepID=A0AAN8PUX8_PATCE
MLYQVNSNYVNLTQLMDRQFNDISRRQVEFENDYIQYTAHVASILALGYLLLSTVVYVWRTYYEMQADVSSSKPLPPGTMGYPIVGETIDFALKGCAFYTEKMVNFGKIFKTHIMGRPTIRLVGADNIKKVVTGENHIVQGMWPASVRILLGKGSLSCQTGESLKQKRMVLLKAMGSENLTYLVPEFQKVIVKCINSWCQQKVILGYLKCRDMTYTMATKVIFGIDLDDEQCKEMVTDFKILIDNLFCLPVKCPGLAFQKATQARVKLTAHIKTLLAQSADRNSGEETCVLDMFKNLPETALVPEDDIIDMLIELMFGGHHTTSSACCSILLHLSQNGEIREKAIESLKENGVMDTSVDLTYAQINQMTYIDNIVKEVLRLKPPVGGGFRKALKTFEVGKYQVPKDWTVIYSIRETHNTSPLFGRPQEFLPERWNDDSLNVPDLRFNYLPFGVGARSCPGEKFAKLKLKIFLIEVLRRSRWTLHNDSPEIVLLPSPHPKDNLPVTFTSL